MDRVGVSASARGRRLLRRIRPDLEWLRRRIATPGALLFLGAFLIYASTSRGTISIIDVQIRYETAGQLFDHGTWVPSAEQVAALPAGAFPLSPRGVPHSIYGPAQSLEMLPAVAAAHAVSLLFAEPEARSEFRGLAGQWFFMVLIVPFVAALGVFFCFRAGALVHLSPRLALLIAITSGFGTYGWFMVKAGLQNVGVTTALLGAVVLLGESRGRISRLTAGSALLGWTLLYRQELIFVVLPLFALFVRGLVPQASRPLRTFAALTLPVSIAGLVALGHNWVRTGSPLANPYQESIGGWKFWSDFPLEHAGHLLFGVERGLLWYSPILWLGLILLAPGWPGRVQFSKRGAWFALPFVAFFAFIASMDRAANDWSWGPRFLVPLTPFLLLGLASMVRERFEDPRLVRWLVPVLALNLVVQGIFCFWPHEPEIYQVQRLTESRERSVEKSREVFSSPLAGRLRNLGVPVPLPEGSVRSWDDPAVQALRPRFVDQLWWCKLPEALGKPQVAPACWLLGIMLFAGGGGIVGGALRRTGPRTVISTTRSAPRARPARFEASVGWRERWGSRRVRS